MHIAKQCSPDFYIAVAPQYRRQKAVSENERKYQKKN